jgi:dipeptidase D
MEFGIVSMAGGLKDNAIPRECSVELLIAPEEKKELEEAIAQLGQTLKKEYSMADPDICIVTEKVEENAKKQVLSYQSMTKVIFYLRSVPNGVQHMSQVMKGLVETSLNLGILELKQNKEEACALSMVTSVRSSVSSRKMELAAQLEMLAGFLGGEIRISGDYPAWEYCADSAIRDTISSVYQELFGKEPVFEAIHAGLECGILSGKIKNLDCVSFGPDNYDIHTPKERLSISSTEKVWKLIVTFLERCKA